MSNAQNLVLFGVLAVVILSVGMMASPYGLEFKPIGQSGSKQYFTTIVPRLFKWSEALQFCREHGMTLATVETSDENAAIQVYVNTTTTSTPFYWMGGTDLFNSTLPEYGREYNYWSWSWLTQGNPNLNIHYWLKGHPLVGSRKHCMYTTQTKTTVIQTGIGTIYLRSNWGASDCVEDTHQIICELRTN